VTDQYTDVNVRLLLTYPARGRIRRAVDLTRRPSRGDTVAARVLTRNVLIPMTIAIMETESMVVIIVYGKVHG
jgi:hypothetical protein